MQLCFISFNFLFYVTVARSEKNSKISAQILFSLGTNFVNEPFVAE